MQETTTVSQDNQLAVIVKESGLEQSKAQILLNNFSNYFDIAADWENKAKTLVVTSESQLAEMKMAREGRLFLKSKRVAIENTRKELKEQSLREGQTIDAIAKILKNLIEPIEEHLEKQEKFIEIRETQRKEERKAKRVQVLTALNFDFTYTDLLNMPDEQYDALVLKLENERDARIEAERKAEEERIAKEKAEAEERERIRIENERLKKEAEERERIAAEERRKYEQEIARREEERRKAEEKERKEREAIEEKARLERLSAEAERKRIEAEANAKLEEERKERERIAAELKAKKDAEEKAEQERLLSEKKAAAAPDKQKLISLAKQFESVIMPELKTPEAISILTSIAELQGKLVKYITDKANSI